MHTGKLPPLQYNPDTKASPTNLLFDRKCLLSPFIALCLTPPVTLLERHHRQRWNKQKAKPCQQPRQQKPYYLNNLTTGAKTELVYVFGTCRGTAATTAATGRVSPRLVSMAMLPNDIAHRHCHSTRRTTMLHHILAPKLSQGAREYNLSR